MEVATTKEPTVSRADFAVSGTRSPRSDEREKEEEEEEEVNPQSIKTGYGD